MLTCGFDGVPELRVSAVRGSDGNLRLFAVNAHAQPIDLVIAIDDRSTRQFEVVCTDATRRAARLPPLQLKADQSHIVLPARSVTTLREAA
jgi:hypothetical protein